MVVKMTNREHPDQTASVEARLSWQVSNVRNVRKCD